MFKLSALISMIGFLLSGSTAAAPVAHPNFSLHNKSGREIMFWIQNGNKQLWTFAGADQFVDLPTDIKQKTVIAVYNTSHNPSVRPNLQQQGVYAEIPAGKTVYVNWDGKKLYPQRGPWLGIWGVTDLGYSTTNNLKLDDIKVGAPKEPPFSGEPNFPRDMFKLTEIIRSNPKK